MSNNRVRTLLVCPGLGHVQRGFESFTEECFEALRDDDRLDLDLFKGGGTAADREHTLWCLRRDRAAARLLGATIRRDSYYVEQTTFALALISHLGRLRPDVIFFSDGVVGNLLWRWRSLCRGRFKLLLSNGGPLGPPNFSRIDYIHQVSAVYYDESLRAGRPAETQTLIPYGFRIDPHFHPLNQGERAALRHKLGLPVDRPVVLSVGAINKSHKRMDYIVKEVASLYNPRPFLIMLGQREAETAAVLATADELLGSTGHLFRTVPADEVQDYYDAADVFVLGSLSEGFGRVYVEALARGLRCLAHDYLGSRYVLREHGRYEDFTRSGALAGLLAKVLAEGNSESEAATRHAAARERLSWDRLRDNYVEMILQCAAKPV